ncbi:hypothetical protein LUZ63_016145 [Rhynchospora breviuscula]|uniref:Uncharacterized protein n=1 Tax=Rhynchospora breviuscula TaxID=2022672 RepID=A0A9Q0CDR3_9POAL|nr:hypothetical protein LUZ63_016145 [Rhynchospora breviuscula]
MDMAASFLSLSFILILNALWSSALDNPYYHILVCGTGGNYSQNSTYHHNLKQLISNLINTASLSNGYAYDSYGIIPDQVTGLVLCRGDTVKENCTSCLRDYPMNNLADQSCRGQKEATMWVERCFLHYSNNRFVSTSVTFRGDGYLGDYRDNEIGPFKDVASALFKALASFAAYNTTTKYATGTIKGDYDFSQPIYGLVQCSPDLSGDDCWNCLKISTDTMVNNLTEIYFARVFGLWCDMRFDSSKFYDGNSLLELSFPLKSPPLPLGDGLYPPPLPVQGNSSYSTNKKKKGMTSVMGIILAIVNPIIAIILTSVFCICIRKRRATNRLQHAPYIPEKNRDEQNSKIRLGAANLTKIKTVESLLFDLSVIRAATDNFAQLNKLGQGGFGSVFKGVLQDEREIAVKRLSKTSKQGIEELKNELLLVANLHHNNLVRLLGACLEEEEKLLVYEFVPNRSLDNFIFDYERRKQLDWSKRFNIISGIAKGLQYLHEDSQLRIIHRDLKTSNILLDAKMNPKISDFGLARLSVVDQTKEITKRVVGTLGYMSPEYVMFGYFSTKSDVFSFGVIALEIITGRRNTRIAPWETQTLLGYVWEQWRDGRGKEVVDEAMGDEYIAREAMNCIEIGLLCCQENPDDRPTMSAVVASLVTSSHASSSFLLHPPSRPARIIARN